MEWIVEAESLNDVLNGHMVCFKRLIRCKNCVHFSAGSAEFGIENDCDFHEWYRSEPKEDDYCSKGEPK